MNDERIRQLISLADRAYDRGTAGDQPGFIAEAKRIADHRRRKRSVMRVASVAVLVVGVGVASWLQLSNDKSGSTSIEYTATPDHDTDATAHVESTESLGSVESIEAEIAALETELAAKRIELEAMLDADRAASQAMPRYVAAAETTQDQVEQAAFVIVHQADRKRNELGLPTEAEADYRRVLELFPQTRSAEIARERLNQLAL